MRPFLYCMVILHLTSFRTTQIHGVTDIKKKHGGHSLMEEPDIPHIFKNGCGHDHYKEKYGHLHPCIETHQRYVHPKASRDRHNQQPNTSSARELFLTNADREELMAEEFNTIRISYEIVDDLSSSKSKFLRDTLIPDVVEFIQKLLFVRRVDGPLFAARQCRSVVNGEPEKCEEYDENPLCGPGSSGQNLPIPSHLLNSQREYDENGDLSRILSGGSGINSSDFHVFIFSVKEDTPCSNGVIGSALTCQRDQFDRPTFGNVHLCPEFITTSSHTYAMVKGTAVHEMFHALGFTADSLSLFRDIYSLEPLTPRNPTFPNRAADQFQMSFECGGRLRRFAMPSNDTVKFVDARGISRCDSVEDYLREERCVSRLITPMSKAHARMHFNCTTLEGPDLENQQTCAILGSHWDERTFSTEIMSPMASNYPKLSVLTLAFFEDTGWYLSNYSLIDEWTKGVDFGFQQGCEFVDERCLNPTTDGIENPFPEHFCDIYDRDSESFFDCTMDRTAFGSCLVRRFDEPLPTPFRYFPGNQTFGGSIIEADFCPMVVPAAVGKCIDPAFTLRQFSSRGQKKGIENSICVTSTLHFNSEDFSTGGAGCYEYACFDTHLRIYAYQDDENSQEPVTFDCFAEGELKRSSKFLGELKCPSPSLVCGAEMVNPTTSRVPKPTYSSSPTSSAMVSKSPASTPRLTPSVSSSQVAKEDSDSSDSNSGIKIFGISLSALISIGIGITGSTILIVMLKKNYCQDYITEADLDFAGEVNVEIEENSELAIESGRSFD